MELNIKVMLNYNIPEGKELLPLETIAENFCRELIANDSQDLIGVCTIARVGKSYRKVVMYNDRSRLGDDDNAD